MGNNEHAGVAEARPFPPRKSGPFDGSRPLQLFLDSLTKARSSMVDCGVQTFAFSALNAIPKIALGKWDVEEGPGVLIIRAADKTERLMPVASRVDYYHAILARLTAGAAIANVPKWAADGLKHHYDVKKQHEEYLMPTEAVRTLAGPRNAKVRGNVNRARKVCAVSPYDPAQKAEYLALNAVWYRQNKDLKFRTYDKTSIDWLLGHWLDVAERVPDARLFGTRHAESEQLIAFNMACQLSDEYWTCYTQRYDREHKVKSPNFLGRAELATQFEHLAIECDGTADTKTIKDWKERLACSKVPYFTVKA